MRSSFFHHTQNSSNRVHSLPSYQKIKDFKANANSILLYTTGPWVIGVDYLKPISFDSVSEITNYIGKNVTVKILSVPVKFSDYTTK